jgi:hypothetical protein
MTGNAVPFTCITIRNEFVGVKVFLFDSQADILVVMNATKQ